MNQVHRLLCDKNILLASFLPVLSALSGNIGLQASTTTLRALTTGHASSAGWRDVFKVVRKELSVALLIGLAASLMLLIVGSAWARSLKFGLTTGLG